MLVSILEVLSSIYMHHLKKTTINTNADILKLTTYFADVDPI
jgi:hypothetical protein